MFGTNVKTRWTNCNIRVTFSFLACGVLYQGNLLISMPYFVAGVTKPLAWMILRTSLSGGVSVVKCAQILMM